MLLTWIDWSIIILVLLTTFSIGVYASRTAGKNTTEYFLSGRNLPWWLLGISMVATTFSTDTPNLVTDLVRQDGVAGNWVWWAFLLTGMLTVFLYARLWRRSGLNTDLAFYELRYGGKGASVLRSFRAVYLGFAFNVLAMSGVMLAAIKIGEVVLGWSAIQTIGLSTLITLVFSMLGGLRGVILTDIILFVIAILGAIGAAYYIVNIPEIGSLDALFSHPNVEGKLALIPDKNDGALFLKLMIIPLAVQWWSTWYPGAEPGGGGYIAQRMLAAKSESHAKKATLFFNIMHYALRPWPWILVALASLIIFPDLQSLQDNFPNLSESRIGHDAAYPAMLKFLPTGLIGLILASLVAAYMSTLSTHLNWGASYLVFDFYKKLRPNSSEKHLVSIGRLTNVILVLVAALIAFNLENAKELFDIILLFGAGTGLIFLLRWFWWRINIWSEISAMLVSGIIAGLLKFTNVFYFVPEAYELIFSVVLTTLIWLIITFITPPETSETLKTFYLKIHPSGRGWRRVRSLLSQEEISKLMPSIPLGKAAIFVVMASLFVLATLFLIGNILYGNIAWILVYALISILSLLFLLKNINKI